MRRRDSAQPYLDIRNRPKRAPVRIGRSARLASRPRSKMVERAGVLFPSSAIPTVEDGGVVASADTLRSALINQLLYQEKVQNSLPVVPPATTLQQILAPAVVSDAELISPFSAPFERGHYLRMRSSCRLE